MKITLGQIKTAEPALKTLLNSALPIKQSYWLGRLTKEIEAELKNYEEQRIVLVKKYGKEEDADGNTNVDEARYEEFFDDLAELNNIEVELKYEPIKVDDLGNDVNISPVEMASLDAFLVS